MQSCIMQFLHYTVTIPHTLLYSCLNRLYVAMEGIFDLTLVTLWNSCSLLRFRHENPLVRFWKITFCIKNITVTFLDTASHNMLCFTDSPMIRIRADWEVEFVEPIPEEACGAALGIINKSSLSYSSSFICISKHFSKAKSRNMRANGWCSSQRSTTTTEH